MSDTSDDFDIEPDVHKEPNRLWLVELAFWRPSALTDEEMESSFPDRDGRWSGQTKAALLKHGAKGLDLNQNWALVEQNRSCPVCRRSKVDIFRLSSRGILLANLEEHHDHLRDYVGSRGRSMFGDRWSAELPPGSAEIADTVKHLVSSFSHELVCSECNAADGKAKLMMKDVIPSYFSFSPAEIRTFIEPVPNADHRINEERLKGTWRSCETSVKARTDLIDQALRMIHAGQLHRERGTSSHRRIQRLFDPQFQLYKAFLRESDRDQRGLELAQTTDEFLARSVQKDSPVLAPRTKATSLAVGPTDAEYAAYCDAVSLRRWREAGKDWSCPICYREKRQLLRKSGSRKWTGGIRDLVQPIPETDPVVIEHRRRTLPGFSHIFVIQGSQSTSICSDCAEVTPQMKSRRRDLTDIYLGLDDLKSCIRNVTSHAPHDVDWEEAARRAQTNQAMAPAWEAYWKHRALASRLGHIFRVHAREGGRDRGLEEASEELMFIAEIDEKSEALHLVKWFLQEDTRFDEEAMRSKAAYRARKTSG
jgi:rubredoxin